MKITLDNLIDTEACEEQVTVFKELFGDEVVVTKELCDKYADYFDWDWAAQAFFPGLQYSMYMSFTGHARKVQTELCDAGYAQFRAASFDAEKDAGQLISDAQARYDRTKPAGGMAPPEAVKKYIDDLEFIITARRERLAGIQSTHRDVIEAAYKALRVVQAAEFYATCARIDASQGV